MDNEIKSYYESLKDIYFDICRIEKKNKWKNKIGDKIRIIIILFFILIATQIIPLFILNNMPEQYKNFQLWQRSFSTIVLINFLLWIILTILYKINNYQLVYAGYGRRYQKEQLTRLQKSFMALETTLRYLKIFKEAEHDKTLIFAREHFNIFKHSLPFEIWWYEEDLELIDYNFLSIKYRRNNIPWFELTQNQITIVNTFREFFKKTKQRLKQKTKISELITPLEHLRTLYYCYINNDSPNASDTIEMFTKVVSELSVLEEKSIKTFSERIKENYFLYLLLGYLIYIVVLIILIGMPYILISKKPLTDVLLQILVTAFGTAWLDAEKNISKTNKERKNS